MCNQTRKMSLPQTNQPAQQRRCMSLPGAAEHSPVPGHNIIVIRGRDTCTGGYAIEDGRPDSKHDLEWHNTKFVIVDIDAQMQLERHTKLGIIAESQEVVGDNNV